MWLTKAVDISVSYPVHVVVYTVPTCPAPSRCVSLFKYNSKPILCLGSSCAILTLCILLGCWSLRKPPVLLVHCRAMRIGKLQTLVSRTILPPSAPLSSAHSPLGSCYRRRSCRGAYCECLCDSHHSPRPGSGRRSLQSLSNYRLQPGSL